MSTGSLVVAPSVRFNGVKVFSSTMVAQRDMLGDAVEAWLAHHPLCKPVEFIVTQSSDSRFHCVSIVLLFTETTTRPQPRAEK